MTNTEKKKYGYFEVWKHNKWTQFHRNVGRFLFFMVFFGAITSLMGFEWPNNSFKFFFSIYYLWFVAQFVMFFTLIEHSYSLIIEKILSFIILLILSYFMSYFLGQLLGIN